jgi:hypothetical protein
VIETGVPIDAFASGVAIAFIVAFVIAVPYAGLLVFRRLLDV